MMSIFSGKIGVALGGGGAKGLAHVGALKSLNHHEIKIDCISGTSVGAIIASYYAFGKNLDDIHDLGEKLHAKAVLKLTFNKRGFVSTESIRQMLLKDIGDVNIEDAQIPLAICTTDIESGESIIFRKGKLVDVVCASVAVPGVFSPVEINGRLLVDGGITNNVPINILKKMGAGITIGINLNSVSKYPSVENIFDVMGNAIDIAIDSRTKDQMKSANIEVGIDLSHYSRYDNSEIKDELILVGYDETTKHIQELATFKRFRYLYLLKVFVLGLTPIKIQVPDFIRKIFKTS